MGQDRAPTLRIVATALLTFLIYAAIGLPLAVLPPFAQNRLGCGSVLTGLVISLQYLATVISRSRVGEVCDTRGPKLSVLWGFAACLGSGALLALGAALVRAPAASLAAILLSRLALGVGESFVSTGAITWGIGRVGAAETARVISWNGIATYGGLALAAPLGVVLAEAAGLAAVGAAVAALAVLGLALAARKAAVPLVTGAAPRLGFRVVLRRVLLPGTVLALGSSGFGSVAAFVTLFYGSHRWPGAATALSAFGLAFLAVRLAFTGTIGRWGGMRVAIVSLAVESAGLLLLWDSGGPRAALFAATVAGCGFSLVFPAMGVNAVASVPPANRGAALGVYSVFLDVSLGLTGPITGLFVKLYSLATPFLVASVAAGGGAVLTGLLARRTPRPAS